MKIEITEKPVITKFITIDGIEFKLSCLYSALHQIQETEENDRYGEYSLRDYELSEPETMDKLVEMGYVMKYTGPRQARCYCMVSETKIHELLQAVYEADGQI